jgi:GntR family transcriptional regulator
MNSRFLLSQGSGQPLYLQVMDQIKQKIAVGDWAPGVAIPSIRRLAQDLNISLVTINRAYLELEREGVIVLHQGKATRVSSEKNLAAKLRHHGLKQRLDAISKSAIALGVDLDELQQQLEELYLKNRKRNRKP